MARRRSIKLRAASADGRAHELASAPGQVRGDRYKGRRFDVARPEDDRGVHPVSRRLREERAAVMRAIAIGCGATMRTATGGRAGKRAEPVDERSEGIAAYVIDLIRMRRPWLANALAKEHALLVSTINAARALVVGRQPVPRSGGAWADAKAPTVLDEWCEDLFVAVHGRSPDASTVQVARARVFRRSK